MTKAPNHDPQLPPDLRARIDADLERARVRLIDHAVDVCRELTSEHNASVAPAQAVCGGTMQRSKRGDGQGDLVPGCTGCGTYMHDHSADADGNDTYGGPCQRPAAERIDAPQSEYEKLSAWFLTPPMAGKVNVSGGGDGLNCTMMINDELMYFNDDTADAIIARIDAALTKPTPQASPASLALDDVTHLRRVHAELGALIESLTSRLGG